ncbi:MAG: NAD-glutamate dehydrogenase [Ancalomicrobiaceae bacterium]|nr:NAD-glutamate dehydrogenase [Ancalomicrobiaceae bacterium]
MAPRISRTKDDIIGAVAAALLVRNPDPSIADFASRLYEHGSADDLSTYDPETLADLCAAAYERFASRDLGRHRITLTLVPEADVTIIEIVNDDMPFLLASVLGELIEAGSDIRLVLHPIFAVERDAGGRLVRVGAPSNGKGRLARESFIHIHVARLAEEKGRALTEALNRALTDVRLAVADWRQMLDGLEEALDELKARAKRDDSAADREALEFLKWLKDDNFLFLGTRRYRTVEAGAEIVAERVPESGLGVLRDPSVRVLSHGAENLNTSAALRAFLASSDALIVSKSNLLSRVHRRAPMDFVGVKLFNKKGKLTGELRIVGLFTSTAYTRPVKTIPLIRAKVDEIVLRAGFDPKSHSGKALSTVLEFYPRDELFQIDIDTLFDFGMRILALGEHPRARTLVHRDPFDRFVSALVYVPRDRYTTEARIRIGDCLEKAFDGRVTAFQPSFPEGSLARVQFVLSRADGLIPAVDDVDLEEAIADLIRTWGDRLVDALRARHPHAEADRLVARYGEAFGGAYREAYGAEIAVSDIAVIEALGAHGAAPGPAIDFYQPQQGAGSRELALKLYHPDRPIQLTDRVPILENMGLRVIDERTYSIAPTDRPLVYLHDMTLERADGAAVALDPVLDVRLEQLFGAVWAGRAENDGFNGLALSAGLDWQKIAIIRAYARYLRQVGVPYSQDYIWGATARYPVIAARLVELFVIRFDPGRPGKDREAAAATLTRKIEGQLADVASLDDDAILRRLLNAIGATVRTNWFRSVDSDPLADTHAFKIDAHGITALPEPKPFREIWVYGPRVEGIHMRFGKVARGGLRWSDRAQDFRTEVLGLVKAQQVKNAVIVPVGAKGGFFPKGLKPGMARDAWLREGTAAYEIFVGSLLSLTDTIGAEGIVPPARVVAYEDADPYLVVAADKGTATFSDTANAIAEARGFWLGDAFASGGSAGYDHKKMGITARGAFEAVKRHFREMDIDIATRQISVIGVGDMSGDVFGNGMLLVPTLRLIAAFDHRDIFIDPNPDVAASLDERRRLFDLPRSSWADYDRSVISAGGGVFPRSAKSIPLSQQARAALGIASDEASPAEVMRAILKAEADLLWFGGIGTYVRASSEANEACGDRANDALRVAARELRAKVVGEGANLGMTQRARIEFNLNGGRCNSDAIDNSAGVNCSDVEVNVKIAFGNAMRAGRIDRPERNRIMTAMTDEVATIVLRNNYTQTLAISVAALQGLEDFGQQRRLIGQLERSGRLDRGVEAIPDEATLDERARSGTGLTRAELGVLLAYAKLWVKDELVQSDVPDDAYLKTTLIDYFAPRMRGEFAEAILGHRLAREIVATSLTNALVDRGGATLVVRVANQTGADVAAIVRAFVAAREIHKLDQLFAEIDGLDNRVAGALQLDLYRRVQGLLLNAIVWLTRTVDFSAGIGEVVERFGEAVTAIVPELPALTPLSLGAGPAEEIGRLTAAGVPEDLAIRLGHLSLEAAIGDIVLIAEGSGQDRALAAEAYFQVADAFRIVRLERLSQSIPITDYYDGLALDRARGDLSDAHRALTRTVLEEVGGLSGWMEANRSEVGRALAQVGELTAAERLTVSRFTVATGMIADLARR